MKEKTLKLIRDMYDAGARQIDIAKKVGVTHQRIAQIERYVLLLPPRDRFRAKWVEFTCKNCGKKDTKRAADPRIYCSVLCKNIDARVLKNFKNLSSEDYYRAANALRTKRYYHTVLKLRPEFQKILVEKNRKAYLKRVEKL